MTTADEILRFWFAEGGEARRKLWFAADPEFDRLCIARFLSAYGQAAAGCFDDWRNDARGCLALILLLDQLPRNIFRDTPRAFATDKKAREMARHALNHGFDSQLAAINRAFLYLPFEHSEDLADQHESVRRQRKLAEEEPECFDFARHAEAHFATIERFGRFPHRNRILGRTSTLEEIEFLARDSD